MAESSFSTPLELTTSLWGDVADVFNGCTILPSGYQDCWAPPDGDADFDDITAVVDKFRNLPGALMKPRADLAPKAPDRLIDFVDIPWAVDAFRGLPYPFDGPGECP